MHSLLQGSSPPRDPTQVSGIAGRFFTVWATREVPDAEWCPPKDMSRANPHICECDLIQQLGFSIRDFFIVYYLFIFDCAVLIAVQAVPSCSEWQLLFTCGA